MNTGAPILNIPVAPYIGDYGNQKNVVYSLVGAAPPEYLSLPGRPPDKPIYQSLDLQLTDVDVTTLAKAGFGSLVSASVAAECHFHVIDFGLTTEVEFDTTQSKSIIQAATFGIGYRIALAAYKIDSKFAANVALIAAAASARVASTSFEIVLIGGGTEGLLQAEPLFNNITGEFNLETLAQMKVAGAALIDYYTDSTKTITPELMSVRISPSSLAHALSAGDTATNDYQTLLAAQTYAVNRAVRHQTLTQALDSIPKNSAWKNVNPELVKNFYTNILGFGPNDPMTNPTYDDVIQHIFQSGT